MKILIGFTAVLLAMQAQATKVPFRNLTNLVSDADHILVGKVTKVDMVDARGNQVTDEDARTGPGIENQLRLHVAVATNDVISSTATYVPDKIVIELWKKWHHTLGNRREETEGETFIFLLKGPDFQPVYYGSFHRKLSDRSQIETMLQRKTAQNKASQPTR